MHIPTFEQNVERWFALSGERTRMRLEKLPGGDGRYDLRTAIVEQYDSLTSTWKVYLKGSGNCWEAAINSLDLPNTGLIGSGSEDPDDVSTYEVHVNADGVDVIDATVRGPDALERAKAIVAVHKASGGDAYYRPSTLHMHVLGGAPLGSDFGAKQ